MSNNLKCLVDQKEYRYCPVCEADKNKPSWYSMFCCENCKDIFTVLRDNSFEEISDVEAREELNKLDLSQKSKMTASIQKGIDRLLIQTEQTEKKIVPKAKTVEENRNAEIQTESISRQNESKGFIKKKK